MCRVLYNLLRSLRREQAICERELANAFLGKLTHVSCILQVVITAVIRIAHVCLQGARHIVLGGSPQAAKTP